MPSRIEGQTFRVDELDACLVASTVQLLQSGLRALEQCRPRVRRCGINARLQRLPDTHQLLREAFDGKLARIVQFALGAFAEIFEFRHGTQVAVPVFRRLGLRIRLSRGRAVPRSGTQILRGGPLGAHGFIHAYALKEWRPFRGRSNGIIGAYLRAFKAEPSSFAVTSTIGMTRS